MYKLKCYFHLVVVLKLYSLKNRYIMIIMSYIYMCLILQKI